MKKRIQKMNFFSGIGYNFRGLWFGIKTPKLFFLGLIRLLAVILLTIFIAGIILYYHRDLLGLLWARPESPWIIWIWYLLSVILFMFLVALAAVVSYLMAQIIFFAIIVDLMSRITERKLTGRVEEPEHVPLLRLFLYLIKQEIPRAVVPIILSIILMILGWILPLGSILILLSSLIAVIFLAWDNTDIVPARRMLKFRERFRFLMSAIPFHLGFGIPFLVPGLNLIFLVFAPVGATMYCIDMYKQGKIHERPNLTSVAP
jgi:CysZ protein